MPQPHEAGHELLRNDLHIVAPQPQPAHERRVFEDGVLQLQEVRFAGVAGDDVLKVELRHGMRFAHNAFLDVFQLVLEQRLEWVKAAKFVQAEIAKNLFSKREKGCRW